MVEQLRTTYGDRVTFVIRYFPLPSHFNAERAARRAAGLDAGTRPAADPADDPDAEADAPPPRPGMPPAVPAGPGRRRSGSADLIAAMPHAIDTVLAQNHDATLAEQRQILAAHLATIDARLAALNQAPQMTINVAAPEAPSVQLEAVHHHHIAVAAADIAPAQVQVDVHVPPAPSRPPHKPR